MAWTGLIIASASKTNEICSDVVDGVFDIVDSIVRMVLVQTQALLATQLLVCFLSRDCASRVQTVSQKTA